MRLLVIGAGGHAKVVVDAAEAAGWEIAAVVGEHADGGLVAGHPIALSGDGVDADAFIVAIGDNARRAAAFEEYRGRGLVPAAVVHPAAVISKHARLGDGAFVAASVVVNIDAVIGENAILNTACVVEHDVVVGPHAHIGPNAVLCGAARAGEGALVGAGSSVKPGVSIGAWSVCGTGSAVVSDVADRAVVAGAPARALPASRGGE